MKKGLILSIVISFLLIGCNDQNVEYTDAELSHVNREFRAVWVATVVNIDWPSRPGLPTYQQIDEIIAILDSVQALNMNAVVFQVRPQCDALYSSKLEPWSYYLTGKQGIAPDPLYDPLQVWVDEAHKRGIELHAWFNPYRAHHPKGGPVSDSSIVKKYPHLVKLTDTGYYWMDPGEPETMQHSYDVVMDVVRRYDIDGVHFDDYFYPYGGRTFDDGDSWEKYLRSGGKLSKDDWRRDNVNRFVKRIYRGIKQEKPWVKFGVSPFGIWRPGNPRSIQGYDQYNELFADAKLWLNKGWVDYWTPQLYWQISKIPQSFPVLLGWWKEQNHQKRHLWPGLATFLSHKRGVNEIVNQVMVERGMVPDAPGHVHFRMFEFMHDTLKMNATLKQSIYPKEALVPTSPWLDNIKPFMPRVACEIKQDSILSVNWSHANEDDIFRWIVYIHEDGKWRHQIMNRDEQVLDLGILREEEKPGIDKIAVSAIDRTGNESLKTIVPIE